MCLVIGLSTIAVLSSFAGGAGEAATPDAPVEIRIMGYGGQDPAIKARLLDEVIGDRLSEQGIVVTYEPLEGDYNAALFNALSAGTAADIIYIPVETAPGIIDTGVVANLNELTDISPFIASLNESYTFNGNTYGIAKDFNTLAMFYNRDLFDEAGVDYPDENTTWEDLDEMIRAIAAIGDDVYGAAFPASFDRFGAFAFAAGWDMFDDDGHSDLTDPAMQEAVEWYTGLVRDGVAVQPSDLGQGWGGGAFATERVGIAFEGAWMLGFLRNEAPNLEFGTAMMPIGPSGERGNFVYTVAYGINSQTRNLEQAIAVLEALTSVDAQQFVLEEGLAIPSREAMSENEYFERGSSESDANRVVFEGAESGRVFGFQFGAVGTDWMTPINAALSEVMTGEASVEQALATAQQDLNELLAR
ncbi:MAG: extracellular solute-binding protein [Spirochaetaceae bacterium]|nr:MAG: extracellular solute-binding protein [Spirochaetaceae bacterium]